MAEPAKQTLCTFCGVVDQVTITPDRRVKATGSLGVCVKGANYFQKHLSSHPSGVARLTSPMLRSPYGWERVSWDYAIDMAADSILADRQEFGRDSLGCYGVGQMTLESLWVAKKFFQGHLGTNNICSNAEQCLANNAGGHELVFGNEGPFSCYDDYRHAEAIFFYGHNPAINHPTVFQRYVRQNKGAVKVVIDPRRTDTVDILLSESPHNIHLPVRSGSDVLLNCAIARYLLDEDAWAHDFVAAQVEPANAAEFFRLLREGPYSIDEVVPRITPAGMAADDMRDRLLRACELWKRERVVTTSSVGINQTVGSSGVASILNLHLLTGDMGAPGRGHVRLAGQSNASSELALGYSGRLLPFRMRITDPDHRAKMAGIWGLPHWRINSAPGLPVASFATSERLRTLFVFGTNPARNFPNLARWREKMMDLNVVYIDSYYNPEILEYADIVLPCRTKHETAGIFLNGERRLQYMEPVEEPPFDAWSDVRIVCEIARRIAGNLGETAPALGAIQDAAAADVTEADVEEWVAKGNLDLTARALDEAFTYPVDEHGEPLSEAVWQEIQAASHGFYNEFVDGDGVPIAFDQIRSGEGAQWQGQRRYIAEAGDDRPLFSGVFGADRRRATFHIPPPERLVPFTERGDGGFVLITGRGAMGRGDGGKGQRRNNTAMFNSSTATGFENWPERNNLYVNPLDARRLSITTGSRVAVRNERGEITCPVEVSDDVPAGHVYLTFHPDRAGTHPNFLTSSDKIDPQTWQPLLKDTRVDLIPMRDADG